MKKIIEKITKYDNILVFFLVAILCTYVIALKFSFYDELWNFSFIFKYTNGYRMYGDLNVIITPLFHMLGKILFSLFGNNYIVFRIYNILIYSILHTVTYTLFKKMKTEKIYSLLYTLIIFIILKGNIAAGANYNALVMFFVIIGIILEMNKNSKTNSIFKGLNLFCIFMTKQNIFIFFCVSLLILYIIQTKNIKIKERLKSILIMIVSFLVPMAVFSVYLIFTNSLYDFISYCFLGINEFGLTNLKYNWYLLVYVLLFVAELSVSIAILKIKIINQEIKNNNYIIMPFQILMIFYAYPIINLYHIKLAMIIPTILVIYTRNLLKKKQFLNLLHL